MPMPSVVPNEGSEVVADPVLERRGRRSFSVEFKRRIVAQAAACEGHGEVAALLRREGLYSSHLSIWRAQAVAGERLGLSPKPVGRKAKFDAKDRRVAQLERENAKLAHRLVIAGHLIALQKKAQELMAALDAQETPP